MSNPEQFQSAEQRLEDSIAQFLNDKNELSEAYNKHQEASSKAEQDLDDNKNPEGSDRMHRLNNLSKAIKESLPNTSKGCVRLWRGNRPDEVGHNPSYTNSLEGIALPFLLDYGGVLSYVDIPEEDLDSYLVGGAENSEFILPSEVLKNARIVGVDAEREGELKSNAKPLVNKKADWTHI